MNEIDKSKFNLRYFVAGDGWKDWFKSWGLGWRLIVTLLALLFVATTIFKGCSPKTQTQSQQMTVWPFSFSTITYSPQQQQKQEIKKRPWWLPILFIEGYGFTETSGMGNSRTGMGGRGGARLEW